MQKLRAHNITNACGIICGLHSREPPVQEVAPDRIIIWSFIRASSTGGPRCPPLSRLLDRSYHISIHMHSAPALHDVVKFAMC